MLQIQHAFKQVCAGLCRRHRVGASHPESHTHGRTKALARQADVLGNKSTFILFAGMPFITCCYRSPGGPASIMLPLQKSCTSADGTATQANLTAATTLFLSEKATAPTCSPDAGEANSFQHHDAPHAEGSQQHIRVPVQAHHYHNHRRSSSAHVQRCHACWQPPGALYIAPGGTITLCCQV